MAAFNTVFVNDGGGGTPGTFYFNADSRLSDYYDSTFSAGPNVNLQTLTADFVAEAQSLADKINDYAELAAACKEAVNAAIQQDEDAAVLAQTAADNVIWNPGIENYADYCTRRDWAYINTYNANCWKPSK